MNFENFKTTHNRPAKFTGEAYGIKISIDHDHSDLNIDELMDAFETIAIGLGYHKDSWKNWIMDRANEYQEEENEKWESLHDLEDDFFGKFDIDEKRMDIIGQNGNEGLHYRATQEDEDEFSNDGGFDGRPHFEWGDEPEDDDNLFEGDEWQANEKLKAANERYKSEVKKMKSKKRNTKD